MVRTVLGRGDSRIMRGAFGALVVGLLIAACGSAGNDTTSEVQSGASVGTEVERAAPTTAADPPVLIADTVNGNQVDVSALVGQDALLWFWAPW